jgi:hypothetical protein
MPAPLTSAHTAEPRSLRLTVPYLFRFSLPLALTFLMMSGAAPLVSNGITWMHGAEGERIHLSSFLMTFVTALFVYSPMFIARNVAIRTITDRRSMASFAFFFLFWALVSSVLLVTISRLDTVGHVVFGTLLGASQETELLARQGLLVFVPIPVLIALRGLGQGCHITQGQTWYIGVGTGLRLVTMAVFVFGFGIHRPFTGPVLGGLTYLTGIGVETLFVLITLIGKPLWTRLNPGPVLGFRHFMGYAGPLMLASIFQQLSGPVLVFIVNHARQPMENAATFNLLRDTAWILVSTLMTIQPVIIAHGDSRRHFRIILRFALWWGGLVTLLAALIALTPLRWLIFVNWLQVDNRIILGLTFTSLVWLIPVPAATMLNHIVMSLHTRSGRTAWVTAGHLVGLLVILTGARSLGLSTRDGAVLAVIGSSLFHLVSAAVQSVGLLGDGFRSAIDATTRAEKFRLVQGPGPSSPTHSMVMADPPSEETEC